MMKTKKEIDDLEQENKKLNNRIAELETLVKFYEEQMRLAKNKQFGSSSEKTDFTEQMGLFDEPENTADKKTEEPTLEEITYTRRKREGKREDDLSKLPVETIEYTLSEEEQKCSECRNDLHIMSKEVRRELKVIPAEVKVIEHVKYVYSCRNCETKNDHVPIY